MHWTNVHGLPAPVVAAIIDDDYSKGDSEFSVTELLGAPYQKAQQRRPEMKGVAVDVSDRLYALEGKMLHALLEAGVTKMDGQEALEVERLCPGHTETHAEDRLFSTDMGVRWSGQYDLYYQRDGLWYLEDHKRVSVNEFKMKRMSTHWEEQLNLLALLMRKHGKPVDRVSIHCYYRDWSKAKAYYDQTGEYPPAQYQRVDLNLWSQDRQQAFLESRIREHVMNHDVPCTAEERWVTEEKWAVKMPGAARAERVLNSEALAHEWIAQNVTAKPKLRTAEIEHREGASLRCLLYCDAAAICPYWKELRTGKYGGIVGAS